jgi:mannosyltransferase OCH1-like enzyme
VLIPKIIHQVWDGPMLPGIQECLDSVKRVMPDYDVRVYDGEEVNRIVPERMTLAGKTDIVRNKKLYEEGGWWVDADCYMMKPLNGDCAYSYGLQEQRDGRFNQVCDWLFGSEAGNPDQKRCLDWINTSQLVNSYDGYMRQPYGTMYKRGAKGFLPYNEYGSRYFAKTTPQRRKPSNPTAVHLFMGSWVKPATGVLSEVKEVERWTI